METPRSALTRNFFNTLLDPLQYGNAPMIERDPPARVPRITADERTDAVWELIDMFSGPGRLDVDENHGLNTLGQHPDLARAFLTFNRHLLLSSTLPVRLRQIAIMRVAWIRKGRYIWSSHLRTSLRNGFSGDEFEPIKQGAAADYWNGEERTILRATDELVESGDLGDATWDSLCAFLDRRQVMDFLFTVGAYLLLSLAFNAVRIEREDALLELAARYGVPGPG